MGMHPHPMGPFLEGPFVKSHLFGTQKTVCSKTTIRVRSERAACAQQAHKNNTDESAGSAQSATKDERCGFYLLLLLASAAAWTFLLAASAATL